MEIRLDMESPEPIYLQIMDSIKHLVATGELKPGEQLPTVRQLATDLRINPNTVARAYLELDREGVISTQQGRGTFVSERPDQNHLAQLLHPPPLRRLCPLSRAPLHRSRPPSSRWCPPPRSFQSARF